VPWGEKRSFPRYHPNSGIFYDFPQLFAVCLVTETPVISRRLPGELNDAL